jgi:hypothetical protein
MILATMIIAALALALYITLSLVRDPELTPEERRSGAVLLAMVIGLALCFSGALAVTT